MADVPDDPRLAISMQAMREFHDAGRVTVPCDSCDKPIRVVALSETAWQMTCECGRYNDTLRGL